MVWPSKRELESNPRSEFNISSLAIAVPRDIYGISNSHKLITHRRVERNQNTPLLSLPAEIRGRIWAYAIGGVTLRSHPTNPYRRTWKHQFKLSPDDYPHGMGLLRVCRQIYSEAAFLPLKLGSLYLDNIDYDWKGHAKSAISRLKPFQQKQVKMVQLGLSGITDVSQVYTQQMITEDIWPRIRKLAFVEEIRVLFYSLCDEEPFPNATITMDNPLTLGGREIRVTIQTLDTPWIKCGEE
jgi:hypothetical protein